MWTPIRSRGCARTIGSIFAVKIAKATISELLAWRESLPGSMIGALLTAIVDHRNADYVKPSLILIGNEQQDQPRNWPPPATSTSR